MTKRDISSIILLEWIEQAEFYYPKDTPEPERFCRRCLRTRSAHIFQGTKHWCPSTATNIISGGTWIEPTSSRPFVVTVEGLKAEIARQQAVKPRKAKRRKP